MWETDELIPYYFNALRAGVRNWHNSDEIEPQARLERQVFI